MTEAELTAELIREEVQLEEFIRREASKYSTPRCKNIEEYISTMGPNPMEQGLLAFGFVLQQLKRIGFRFLGTVSGLQWLIARHQTPREE